MNDYIIVSQAYELWLTDNGKEFMDPVLDDSSSTFKLLRCLQVGLLCVQESPIDRPSILEVYYMLRNENDTIVSPKRPAFSVKNSGEVEEDGRKSSQEMGSVNDVTITETLPR